MVITAGTTIGESEIREHKQPGSPGADVRMDIAMDQLLEDDVIVMVHQSALKLRNQNLHD
jgi:hypothetical protein